MLDEATVRKATAFLATPRKMLIGESWLDAASGDQITVEDPATGKTIGHVPAAGAKDVDRAVRAARESFDKRAWRGLTAEKRAAIMWKLSDLLLENVNELSRLEVLDNGMPGVFASYTITMAAEGLRYYAGMCTKLHGRTSQVGADMQFHAFSVSEPVGVAGLIVPWNGPLVVACNKMATALAAGCSVILKPAEQTPLTALRLGELVLEAGIPPGVVNIVTGYGPAAGQALVDHPDVNKISFTGSTAVGKGIVVAAAKNLKRVTLELGGKSPVFVFDDADLAAAIPAASMGIFANSGQVCYAGSRLYAQSKVYDKVVAGLEQAARSITLGSGLKSSSHLGPLISDKQRKRVMEYIDSGRAQGADLVTGGGSWGEGGYFVQPTIFANGSPDMRIVQEEIFGPVLTVMRFDDIDDVGRLGNATSYGLGAGVYTTNISNAHKAARLLDAGNVWVNCYGRTDKSLPFGGFKQSGWGRENGFEGVDAFLEHKSVYIQL
jgi:acyl-CoA reductase-like NAD-dependent aldehyde dehydrogenase